MGTKLKIQLLDEGENVRLVFQDDGIGIPEEYQAEIFDPFVRADNDRNRSTGGSGLGLAITKKIIEKHGGTISLYSDPAGTTFSILLCKTLKCDVEELETEQ